MIAIQGTHMIDFSYTLAPYERTADDRFPAEVRELHFLGVTCAPCFITVSCPLDLTASSLRALWVSQFMSELYHFQDIFINIFERALARGEKKTLEREINRMPL